MERAGLGVAPALARFVEHDVLPGLGLDAADFWRGAAALFARLTPRNRALLAVREEMQARIDAAYEAGELASPEAQQRFLTEIGYLQPEPAPFRIAPEHVDPEVAATAGPQLVVPVLNARFLLNAANARWGSLYDALYGTDALGSPAPAGAYEPVRGAEVVARAEAFLDEAFPLALGGHGGVVAYRVERGALVPALADPAQFAGWRGAAEAPSGVLLRHHGLHAELVIDRGSPVGRAHPAGLADVILESALTTIVDLEDSVAAVDADDKVAAYANWLGLMRGDLTARFDKGGRETSRALEPDRAFTAPDGSPITLPGRSLLFVRNVGHLMTMPAVRLPDGTDAPEGVLDALITSAVALHDLRGLGRHRNSRAGSVYIVKPKMHGPDEAAFANDLFDGVEDVLGLPRHTLKIGLMDEERRTSANLAACIHALKDRIVFINTGFLDRTGDEIHTAMRAGPVVAKADMRRSAWIAAYEARNVATGLACGFAGRAQIGKGMWAAPDRMADMVREKIAHPMAGASTAWTPSPTAATLHALHYHAVDVAARQRELSGTPAPPLSELLTPPLAAGAPWSREEVRAELRNNAQGILGYVVRWIDQGVGCSKVPDIHDVGLMEDRATLRISAQHMANWLLHGVASADEVDAAFADMAVRVDRQNAGDPLYRPLSPDLDGIAYRTARALVFEGVGQPSGYTEPLLHAARAAFKAATLDAPAPGFCEERNERRLMI